MTSEIKDVRELIMKTIVISLILGIVAFLTPNFTIDSIWILLIAGLLISLLDFFLQSYSRIKDLFLMRGLVGFSLSFIILTLTVNILVGVNISIVGLLIVSVLIGLIDIIVHGN